MQALADAEPEFSFTRLLMAEFLGFLVNLGFVDERVQRVDGVLVIDAKAIYDSMFGASGFLAMEEKMTAIEMTEIQERMKRQNAFPRWCEANLSDELTKETAKTQLERFYDDGCVWSLVHDEDVVSARKRRQQSKQPPAEETTCPIRDLEKDWVDDWPTDAIYQNEPILDESDYERAYQSCWRPRNDITYSTITS